MSKYDLEEGVKPEGFEDILGDYEKFSGKDDTVIIWGYKIDHNFGTGDQYLSLKEDERYLERIRELDKYGHILEINDGIMSSNNMILGIKYRFDDGRSGYLKDVNWWDPVPGLGMDAKGNIVNSPAHSAWHNKRGKKHV